MDRNTGFIIVAMYKETLHSDALRVQEEKVKFIETSWFHRHRSGHFLSSDTMHLFLLFRAD